MFKKDAGEYVVSVDVMGLQNVESEIEKELKKHEYCLLTNVARKERNILLAFKVDFNEKKHPCFVKQVSKKKYEKMNDFIFKQERLFLNAYYVGSIETANSWILFFNK